MYIIADKNLALSKLLRKHTSEVISGKIKGHRYFF